jgi:hypothetical protein
MTVRVPVDLPSRATPTAGARRAQGAAAGVAGGVLLAGVLHLFGGVDARLFARLIAATVLGTEAGHGGDTALALGMVLHLLVAAGWGVLFAAALARRRTVGGALLDGLLFGLFVMAVMTFAAVPAFDYALWDQVAPHFGWWTAAHLAYGAVVALSLALAAGLPLRAPAVKKRRRR